MKTVLILKYSLTNVYLITTIIKKHYNKNYDVISVSHTMTKNDKKKNTVFRQTISPHLKAVKVVLFFKQSFAWI